jgi:hypothetical protein
MFRRYAAILGFASTFHLRPSTNHLLPPLRVDSRFSFASIRGSHLRFHSRSGFFFLDNMKLHVKLHVAFL